MLKIEVVAGRLGVKRGQVYRLIKKGLLRSRTDGFSGLMVVDEEELQRYRKVRRGVGNPEWSKGEKTIGNYDSPNDLDVDNNGVTEYEE